MNDDLVARLRVNDAEIYLPILGQAADRIEALEAENERLREALHAIQAELSIHSYDEARWAVRIARAALKEIEGDWR